jgi:hypothetical protein
LDEPEERTPPVNKRRLRSTLLFLLACFTSPCCTPLLVPLFLALVAGTPIAVWTSNHLGWVYGVLTIISLISFILGFRWMSQRKRLHPDILPRQERPDISPLLEGEKVHVEYTE